MLIDDESGHSISARARDLGFSAIEEARIGLNRPADVR
jgi:hypothetical protein